MMLRDRVLGLIVFSLLVLIFLFDARFSRIPEKLDLVLTLIKLFLSFLKSANLLTDIVMKHWTNFPLRRLPPDWNGWK